MIKAECDRCKTQLPAPDDRFPSGLVNNVPLPDGWRRVFMPYPDAMNVQAEERWELCEKCVNDLRTFLDTDPAGLLPLAVSGVERTGCIAHGGPDCVCTKTDEAARKPVDVTKYEDSRWPWAVVETHPTPDREHVSVRCAEHGWSTARSFRGSEMNPTTVGNWIEEAMSIHMDTTYHATPRDGTANVLACTLYEPGGECVGHYDRGKFPEHARRYHPAASGPKKTDMANGGTPCPFCSGSYVSAKIGQHVAAKHPGKWQEWADAQAAENRRKAAVFNPPSPAAFALKDITES